MASVVPRVQTISSVRAALTKRATVRRAASKDKELVLLEGVSHYDLYDRPQAIGRALARVTPFLRERLAQR